MLICVWKQVISQVFKEDLTWKNSYVLVDGKRRICIEDSLEQTHTEAGGFIVAHNFRHMFNRMDTGNQKEIWNKAGSTSSRTPSK